MEKCRIRKRFPFPDTIWDGDEVVHKLKVSARMSLEEFFTRNKYPNDVEKQAPAEKNELTVTQVNDFFKNHRQRSKKKSTAAIRRGEI